MADLKVRATDVDARYRPLTASSGLTRVAR
jgi:hypothetical protein